MLAYIQMFGVLLMMCYGSSIVGHMLYRRTITNGKFILFALGCAMRLIDLKK